MILLDTSLIVAYANTADQNHGRAVEVMKAVAEGVYGTPVITDYVFNEVVTVTLIKAKSLAKPAS